MVFRTHDRMICTDYFALCAPLACVHCGELGAYPECTEGYCSSSVYGYPGACMARRFNRNKCGELVEDNAIHPVVVWFLGDDYDPTEDKWATAGPVFEGAPCVSAACVIAHANTCALAAQCSAPPALHLLPCFSHQEPRARVVHASATVLCLRELVATVPRCSFGDEGACES